MSTNGERAAKWLREVADMVVRKNKSHGDSIGSPVRIFCKSPSVEGIKVRLDDKLSRIARGNSTFDSDSDVLKDLVGYLALLATHETHPDQAVCDAYQEIGEVAIDNVYRGAFPTEETNDLLKRQKPAPVDIDEKIDNALADWKSYTASKRKDRK